MIKIFRSFRPTLCSPSISFLPRTHAQRIFRMMSTTRISPFTQCVVESMRCLYPEALADHSFDNTGLLLSSPINPYSPPLANRVLLTIDLTRRVADEALREKCSIVVAYHPIIFRGLKSVTTNDSQQETLLRLAQQGVSVYCPHTTVDVVPDGMGDWLAGIIRGHEDATMEVINAASSSSITAANNLHEPSKNGDKPPYANNNTGSGRFVTFEKPQKLVEVIRRISRGTGLSSGVSVAIPQGETMENMKIRTVALCNGSGGSVIRGCSTEPELVVTGELSHHEALAVIERGGCVVTLFHSNSERGYLETVMRDKLRKDVEERWRQWRKEDSKPEHEDEQSTRILQDDSVKVIVSRVDRDPYQIIRIEESPN